LSKEEYLNETLKYIFLNLSYNERILTGFKLEAITIDTLFRLQDFLRSYLQLECYYTLVSSFSINFILTQMIFINIKIFKAYNKLLPKKATIKITVLNIQRISSPLTTFYLHQSGRNNKDFK